MILYHRNVFSNVDFFSLLHASTMSRFETNFRLENSKGFGDDSAMILDCRNVFSNVDLFSLLHVPTMSRLKQIFA